MQTIVRAKFGYIECDVNFNNLFLQCANTIASRCYIAGIPAARIMLITGHKTEVSFFKYIRITKTENALSLAEHPFFS